MQTDDGTSRRPQLLEVRHDGHGAVGVTLAWGGRTVLGVPPDDAPRTSSSPVAVVAHATLDAIRQLAPVDVGLELDWLTVVPGPDGRPPVVVAVVDLVVAGIRLTHAGSVVADDDLELSVARAVLTAVNRRLDVLGF